MKTSKYNAIRTEIKKLSDSQRELKPQRKQSFSGTRTSSNPSYQVLDNRYELRHLFQAYAIIKGKDRPVIKKEDKYVSESKVQELVKRYTPVVTEEV